jgi:hypothetical protein
MGKFKLILVSLIGTIWLGCQGATEQAAQAVSQDYFASGPKLVKIPVQDATVADSLINLGMDVIVVESDYVIARIGGQQSATIQAMALQLNTFKEEELVQRLVNVVTRQKSDVNELAAFGIDIWEVKGDTVVAQVFDKHIRQMQESGYTVAVIERNVLNVVDRSQK